MSEPSASSAGCFVGSDAAVEVALVHPQIAPNAGNVGRTCVAVGAGLHLVRPMGFSISDRQLKRAGMDYWQRLRLTVHEDLAAFEAAMTAGGRRLWLFDSAGETGLWDVAFAPRDVLVFGSEALGLPTEWIGRRPQQAVRIPQVAGERCLNLSTSVGVALYEALRQIRPHSPSR